MANQAPLGNGPPTGGDTDGFKGLRVLYVEDHPDMQRAVDRLLKVAGASVAIARDGLEATVMALSETFDLVLMDLRMPHMDGFEAARALIAADCRAALVAVTADASPAVRANAHVAGFAAVLQKPFDLCDITDAMRLARELQSVQTPPTL
ncbi:MAG TPA: response regulator [Gemmatimonadaceae bacterium]|nr:response regulator [Gemmatimonadaceae bacterium]